MIGVGAYNNETGFADDDGPAVSIGFGARYFPTDMGLYLGLDARALGFFGDDATTGNGVIGLAIGWVVDTTPILGD
ncbi:MAG: hypothetical protein QF570_12025 [Myxococcota bacterium]|nr:hypothetical protein [Myxococcota bacterium]